MPHLSGETAQSYDIPQDIQFRGRDLNPEFESVNRLTTTLAVPVVNVNAPTHMSAVLVQPRLYTSQFFSKSAPYFVQSSLVSIQTATRRCFCSSVKW
jgi:hypothetical protein